MFYQDITNSLLRAILAFLLLMLVARFMGRKAISQMTFFDFAVGITLGSVTANLALGPQSSTASAVTTLIILSILGVLSDYSHIKSFIVRKFVNSEPVVVVANGNIVDENMKKVRFTINDLNTLLREKNTFNIADVEFAVLENDGKLSVLPKSQKQPLTPSDLNIPTSYKGLTKDIIIDGNVMLENLKDVNLNEEWLLSKLGEQGIGNAGEVFYAGLDTSGNIYVSKKNNGNEKHGKYGIE
ncbi:YetF domain-containing protein [Lutispora sp.]|uniref:YetF domain-containing protein n=1 Tax=Lutispora sp. TaxID=2828727 RepID=UPI003565E269